MRNRLSYVSLACLAMLLWVGLIVFMNRKPPDSVNQTAFLVIFGCAVSCTLVPLTSFLNARLSAPWRQEDATSRGVRQGLLLGALATALVALRFMRSLGLITATILTLVVLMIEVLIRIKNR